MHYREVLGQYLPCISCDHMVGYHIPEIFALHHASCMRHKADISPVKHQSYDLRANGNPAHFSRPAFCSYYALRRMIQATDAMSGFRLALETASRHSITRHQFTELQEYGKTC